MKCSIITIKDDGFTIQLYEMTVGKKYPFKYKDSNYEVMRDENDNLVLTSIEEYLPP